MRRMVRAGSLKIGGGAPCSVQSMASVPTTDVAAVLRQARRVARLGCDLFRVTVPDAAAAAALPELVEKSPLPLVADIHFDYRLALAAVKAGIAKLRINPGNIGDERRTAAVAEACGKAGIPIRIGVNGGSLREDVRQAVLAGRRSLGEAMGEHALKEASLLAGLGFKDIVISVKASEVRETLKAYRFLAGECDYPLHIGITEAGGAEDALLKSGAGLGALLMEGIGDTLRISITGPVEKEALAGRKLLQFLGLREYGPQVVSCPTCGRTQVPLEKLAARIERSLRRDALLRDFPCRVAVMGCAVNGPGEARGADAGLAGGKGYFLLFAKGEPLGRVAPEEAWPALRQALLEQRKSKMKNN